MAREALEASELRKIFCYNPITGAIKWKISPSSCIKAGSVAGTVSKASGYIRIGIRGWNYAAHQLAWAIHYGKWPDMQIDHIDGDRSNNRKSNMRLVTNAENAQNRKPAANSKSGIVGVTWSKASGGWQAKITLNGAEKNLGTYSTKEAAAARYAEEKRRLHKISPITCAHA